MISLTDEINIERDLTVKNSTSLSTMFAYINRGWRFDFIIKLIQKIDPNQEVLYL